ncbi:MAG: hypothetical protein NZ605_01845 [Acidimicrobiales bacterium]|nr:hypothetical protein [Acidimicrobiales bacterium]
MAGYDPNRPRPTDSGAFVGLPGDRVTDHPESQIPPAREITPEQPPTASTEDEMGPRLQTVPQAVPPLDRRVPAVAVVSGLAGLVAVLWLWRRIAKRDR